MGPAVHTVCVCGSLLLRLESLLRRLLELLLTATFMVIFALVVLLVVLRYAFNSTIVGGNEATVMLFIFTTALGAAVDVGRGKHIIVDFFVNFLPAGFRHWLDIVNLAIVATLNVFLLNYSIDWIAAVGSSENPVLHIPEGVVEIALPIGCALTILFCITRIASTLMAKPRATLERDPSCQC
jgi:TRAP-type C4-dicarboxylate transport system permease small subunit